MVQLNLAKAVTCFERGIKHAERGNLDRAIASFEEALRIQPSYLEAKIALGQALIDQGESDAAIEILLDAQQQAPTDIKVLVALGLAHFSAMEIDEAVLYWEQAFKLGYEELPDTIMEDIGIPLVASLRMMEEYERAAAILAILERRFPQSAGVLLCAADLYLAQEALDDALRSARRAVELDAECADAYLLLGKIYLSREEPESAFAALTSARELDPELPGVDATLALEYLHREDTAEALRLADDVMSREELDRDEIFTCAVVYASTGQITKTDDLWREMLEEDPEDFEAFSALMALAVETKNLEILTWLRELFADEDPEVLAVIDACAREITPGRATLRARRKLR